MFPMHMRNKIIGLVFPRDKTSSLAKFELSPLRQDNRAWLDSRVRMNDTMVSFSLYHSQLIRDAGFRLRDAACFERLSALFRSSKDNLAVPVTSEVGILRDGQIKNRINLFGEIFMFDRSMIRTAGVMSMRKNATRPLPGRRV